MFRFLSFLLALVLLSSCGLPSTEGQRSDARATLMRYWSSWEQGDFKALVDLSCQEDQAQLSSVAKEMDRVITEVDLLGFEHNVKRIDEAGLLAKVLGSAPNNLDIGLSTQIALKRTSLGPGGRLGAWTLSLQGKEFFVCLSKAARARLKNLRSDLAALSSKVDGEKASRKISVE